MSTPASNPFPAIPDAPFWRPITEEELTAYVGKAPPPGEMTLFPDWELALFSVTQRTGPRATIVGWVQEPFAVNGFISERSGCYLGKLTHLPSGIGLGRFYTDACAARAAAVYAGCAAWADKTRAPKPGLALAFTGGLRAAGFVPGIVGSPESGEETVWRGPTHGAAA